MEGFKAYSAAGGTLLVATQEQARQHGSFVMVLVPYKKAELLTFINERTLAAFEAGAVEQSHLYAQPATAAVLPASGPDPIPMTTVRDWTPDSVMEWILDRATKPQIEEIFARLGARFHEEVRK